MIIRILTLLLAVASGVLSYQLFQFGMDWIYDGYGINPMFAWPLCWLYICVTFYTFKQFLLTFKPVADFCAWLAKMDAAPYTDADQAELKEQKQVAADKLKWHRVPMR